MSKRIEISQDYILKLPITTNKLNVALDMDKFLERYSIVSYKTGASSKNLSYEQLSDTPSLAVVGIWSKYEESAYYTRFFVLTYKEEVRNVINSLRLHDDITAKVDNLSLYEGNTQKRIVASLAINSLGVGGKKMMLYNNGFLLVCDDNNFGIPKSRKELVCLKIEVNRYMNLTAKTMTFTTPRDIKDLRRHSNCVFSVGKETEGCLWLGHYVKPIVVKDVATKCDHLDKLYIPGKRFTATHNMVPYWPWNVKKYNHGKLFVLWQVMEAVNQRYEGLLHLDFTSYQALDYYEYRPKEEILKMLKEYFQHKSIYIEDPIKSTYSNSIVKTLRQEIANVAESITFAKKESCNDMVIRLCGSKEDKDTGLFYTQSLERIARSSTALQHVAIGEDAKEDKIVPAKARRILLELLVKDCISKQTMPLRLAEKLDGWRFFRWKLKDGRLYGASLSPATNGSIILKQYGFDMGLGEDYDNFIREEIGYEKPQKIKGSHEHIAMCKDGNTYLLIDTDEIPILDAKLIDEFYDGSGKKSGVVTTFKNKGEAMNHRFLRGYMGLHIWKSEGIDNGEAYSYIAGWNSENMSTGGDFKIDKMPRARRIFVIKKTRPKAVADEIQEIKQMLKEDFGRWNEIMTYPFPFKFLQEYLDIQCEGSVFSKHWYEL